MLDRLGARRRTNTGPRRICSLAIVIAGIVFALALAGIPAIALAHTASVNTVSGLKAAITNAQTDNLDDTISLKGNISFASTSDTIAMNVTDGKTLTIEGGGFSLDGGNLSGCWMYSAATSSLTTSPSPTTNCLATAATRSPTISRLAAVPVIGVSLA